MAAQLLVRQAGRLRETPTGARFSLPWSFRFFFF
jgi:hypothetical protein